MNDQIKTTPAEKWIINPVNNFIKKSTTGGIVLFVSAIVAIILANSSLSDWYHHIWEHKIGFTFDGETYLNYSIHHWVNDGLMAVFFFVVGLELKREIIGGELSNPKNALLPIVAAVGGMVFPALIYGIFNSGTESAHGWGIPMATDIAFALGVLYLLGSKIPTSLKVFLTALAIVDDLGAVLVIAFFYTAEINFPMLFTGIGFVAFLFFSKAFGIRNTLFYAIIGIFGVWLPFLLSGVHATIAAVLVAFTIPADSKVDEIFFITKIKQYLERFKNADTTNTPTLTEEQLHILEHIRVTTKDAMTPLQRLEHGMHNLVSFIVMPIFALANAGVTFSNDILAETTSNVTLGVVFGLVAGKVIGVFGVSIAMIKLKWANMPLGLTNMHLFGVGLLASIGFTMSLFVTNLAFNNPEYELQAKLGIFMASTIGGLIGFFILNKNSKSKIIINSNTNA
ncbi:NhaA family Na+:H+ antiporter [Flavobacterium arsenatis]|uniref:Na(+)/H(+) antiporter NhaA n=1 Tax=Flavobacterium arsenatis TaxID=1484332 RepID=A0ABU1TNT8_9FLAO|nr:Na+/H+ antiporter NhaA [Flavobacterium arsenatis]MDR6967467.1 NhaA family Na+:H+ antiporter [Flavobacterium arsenatis]